VRRIAKLNLWHINSCITVSIITLNYFFLNRNTYWMCIFVIVFSIITLTFLKNQKCLLNANHSTIRSYIRIYIFVILTKYILAILSRYFKMIRVKHSISTLFTTYQNLSNSHQSSQSHQEICWLLSLIWHLVLFVWN
jgi:hypothetical protein